LRLIGVDGCKAGWVLASADIDLKSLYFEILQTLDSIIGEAHVGDALVIIDVPIGLPSNRPRECDVAARACLPKGRKSSVFPTPCQAALAGQTPDKASQNNFVACGNKLSKQTLAILPKIQQVDNLMTPQLQTHVREAHPEVTFATLAGPLPAPQYRKRTRQGKQERLQILRQYFPGFSLARVTEERCRLGYKRVADDDIIDAVACLVTASRVQNGTARVLPPGSTRYSGRGLQMEIVA
jgi:predicted RNase H-like nuclease